MSPNVSLSEPVKARLEKYRDEMEHRSMDSAMREVMLKAGLEINPDELDLENDEEDSDGDGDNGDNGIWGG